MRSQNLFALPSVLPLALLLGGCLTNVLDPEQGGVFVCVDDSECPGSQACLQQVCEAIELPDLVITNPEDGRAFPFGEPHGMSMKVTGENLTLRALSDSKDAVPGEGHLVIFVDEVEVTKIDKGDLSAGVTVDIDIPDTPGAHRLRAQARLNNGTDYDNETASARNLVWIDNGRQHVALRSPWPGDAFGLEAQKIEAEVAVFGGISIGPPMTMKEHVHVYYGVSFPGCQDDPMCQPNWNGVVPQDENEFGPVQLPASSAVEVTLTAVVAKFDHTSYFDMGETVFSEIKILRSDNQ